MFGFPTAFTLMGMGMIVTWIADEEDTSRNLTPRVQSAFRVMGNDVLISMPLFVFMGIQVIAIVLLCNFPAIGMGLPEVLYSR